MASPIDPKTIKTYIETDPAGHTMYIVEQRGSKMSVDKSLYDKYNQQITQQKEALVQQQAEAARVKAEQETLRKTLQEQQQYLNNLPTQQYINGQPTIKNYTATVGKQRRVAQDNTRVIQEQLGYNSEYLAYIGDTKNAFVTKDAYSQNKAEQKRINSYFAGPYSFPGGVSAEEYEQKLKSELRAQERFLKAGKYGTGKEANTNEQITTAKQKIEQIKYELAWVTPTSDQIRTQRATYDSEINKQKLEYQKQQDSAVSKYYADLKAENPFDYTQKYKQIGSSAPAASSLTPEQRALIWGYQHGTSTPVEAPKGWTPSQSTVDQMWKSGWLPDSTYKFGSSLSREPLPVGQDFTTIYGKIVPKTDYWKVKDETTGQIVTKRYMSPEYAKIRNQQQAATIDRTQFTADELKQIDEMTEKSTAEIASGTWQNIRDTAYNRKKQSEIRSKNEQYFDQYVGSTSLTDTEKAQIRSDIQKSIADANEKAYQEYITTHPTLTPDEKTGLYSAYKNNEILISEGDWRHIGESIRDNTDYRTYVASYRPGDIPNAKYLSDETRNEIWNYQRGTTGEIAPTGWKPTQATVDKIWMESSPDLIKKQNLDNLNKYIALHPTTPQSDIDKLRADVNAAQGIITQSSWDEINQSLYSYEGALASQPKVVPTAHIIRTEPTGGSTAFAEFYFVNDATGVKTKIDPKEYQKYGINERTTLLEDTYHLERAEGQQKPNGEITTVIFLINDTTGRRELINPSDYKKLGITDVGKIQLSGSQQLVKEFNKYTPEERAYVLKTYPNLFSNAQISDEERFKKIELPAAPVVTPQATQDFVQQIAPSGAGRVSGGGTTADYVETPLQRPSTQITPQATQDFINSVAPTAGEYKTAHDTGILGAEEMWWLVPGNEQLAVEGLHKAERLREGAPSTKEYTKTLVLPTFSKPKNEQEYWNQQSEIQKAYQERYTYIEMRGQNGEVYGIRADGVKERLNIPGVTDNTYLDSRDKMTSLADVTRLRVEDTFTGEHAYADQNFVTGRISMSSPQSVYRREQISVSAAEFAALSAGADALRTGSGKAGETAIYKTALGSQFGMTPGEISGLRQQVAADNALATFASKIKEFKPVVDASGNVAIAIMPGFNPNEIYVTSRPTTGIKGTIYDTFGVTFQEEATTREKTTLEKQLDVMFVPEALHVKGTPEIKPVDFNVAGSALIGAWNDTAKLLGSYVEPIASPIRETLEKAPVLGLIPYITPVGLVASVIYPEGAHPMLKGEITLTGGKPKTDSISLPYQGVPILGLAGEIGYQAAGVLKIDSTRDGFLGGIKTRGEYEQELGILRSLEYQHAVNPTSKSQKQLDIQSDKVETLRNQIWKTSFEDTMGGSSLTPFTMFGQNASVAISGEYENKVTGLRSLSQEDTSNLRSPVNIYQGALDAPQMLIGLLSVGSGVPYVAGRFITAGGGALAQDIISGLGIQTTELLRNPLRSGTGLIGGILLGEAAMPIARSVTGIRYTSEWVGDPYLQQTIGSKITEKMGASSKTYEATRGSAKVWGITVTDPITSTLIELGKKTPWTREPVIYGGVVRSGIKLGGETTFTRLAGIGISEVPEELVGIQRGARIKTVGFSEIEKPTIFETRVGSDYITSPESTPYTIEISGNRRIIASTSKGYEDVTGIFNRVPPREYVKLGDEYIALESYKSPLTLKTKVETTTVLIPETVAEIKPKARFDPFGTGFGEREVIPARTVSIPEPAPTKLSGWGIKSDMFREVVLKEGFIPNEAAPILIPALSDLLKKEGRIKAAVETETKTPYPLIIEGKIKAGTKAPVTEEFAFELSDVYRDVQHGKISTSEMFERQLATIEAVFETTKTRKVFDPYEVIERKQVMQTKVRTGNVDYIEKILPAIKEKWETLASEKYGQHGAEHAENVYSNLMKLREKSPELQKYSPQEIRAAAYLHDIAKFEKGATPEGYISLISHEKIGAETLARGYLDDLDIVRTLTEKEKGRVATAISEHGLLEPTTDFGQALKLADRLDLTRFGKDVPAIGDLTIREHTRFNPEVGVEFVQKGPLFKGHEALPYKVKPVKWTTIGSKLLDTLKEEFPEHKMGGSFAQATQSEYVRMWADIDLYIPDPIKAKQMLIEQIVPHAKLFEEAGINIYKKEGQLASSLFDIHEMQRPGEGIGRFGIKTDKPITAEGLKIMSLREQILRKSTQIAEVRPSEEGWYTGVEPHRGKDIADTLGGLATIGYDILHNTPYEKLINGPIAQTGEPLTDTIAMTPHAIGDLLYGSKLRKVRSAFEDITEMLSPDYMPTQTKGGFIYDPLYSAKKRLGSYHFESEIGSSYTKQPFTRTWTKQREDFISAGASRVWVGVKETAGVGADVIGAWEDLFGSVGGAAKEKVLEFGRGVKTGFGKFDPELGQLFPGQKPGEKITLPKEMSEELWLTEILGGEEEKGFLYDVKTSEIVHRTTSRELDKINLGEEAVEEIIKRQRGSTWENWNAEDYLTGHTHTDITAQIPSPRDVVSWFETKTEMDLVYNIPSRRATVLTRPEGIEKLPFAERRQIGYAFEEQFNLQLAKQSERIQDYFSQTGNRLSFELVMQEQSKMFSDTAARFGITVEFIENINAEEGTGTFVGVSRGSVAINDVIKSIGIDADKFITPEFAQKQQQKTFEIIRASETPRTTIDKWFDELRVSSKIEGLGFKSMFVEGALVDFLSWDQRGLTPSHETLVATLDNKIAGALSYHPKDFSALYIETLGSIKEGGGTTLVTSLENIGIGLQKKSIELYPINAAKPFYSKLGFTRKENEFALTWEKLINKQTFTKKEQYTRDPLNFYITSGHDPINKVLRGKEIRDLIDFSEVEKHIESMDTIFEPLNEDITLYRGFGGKTGARTGVFGKSGDIISDAGFASYTRDISTAIDFSTHANYIHGKTGGNIFGVILKSEVSRGTPAFELKYEPGMWQHREKEVILARGSLHEITSIRDIERSTLNLPDGFYPVREGMYRFIETKQIQQIPDPFSGTIFGNVKPTFTKKEQLGDININIKYDRFRILSVSELKPYKELALSSIEEIDKHWLGNQALFNRDINIIIGKRKGSQYVPEWYPQGHYPLLPDTIYLNPKQFKSPQYLLSHEILHQQGISDIKQRWKLEGVTNIESAFIDLPTPPHTKQHVQNYWAYFNGSVTQAELTKILTRENFEETMATVGGIYIAHDELKTDFRTALWNVVPKIQHATAQEAGEFAVKTANQYADTFEQIVSIYKKPEFTKKDQLKIPNFIKNILPHFEEFTLETARPDITETIDYYGISIGEEKPIHIAGISIKKSNVGFISNILPRDPGIFKYIEKKEGREIIGITGGFVSKTIREMGVSMPSSVGPGTFIEYSELEKLTTPLSKVKFSIGAPSFLAREGHIEFRTLHELPLPTEAGRRLLVPAYERLLKEEGQPGSVEIFKSNLKLAEVIQTTPTIQTTSPVTVMESLDWMKPGMGKEIIDVIKEDPTHFIYGTFAARVFNPFSKLPRDVDISTDYPPVITDKLSNIVSKYYGKENVDVDEGLISLISGRSATGKPIYKNIFDIHSQEDIHRFDDEIEYGFHIQPPVNVEGINLMSYGEQSLNKVLITLNIYPTPSGFKVGARPGQEKTYADVYALLKQKKNNEFDAFAEKYIDEIYSLSEEEIKNTIIPRLKEYKQEIKQPEFTKKEQFKLGDIFGRKQKTSEESVEFIQWIDSMPGLSLTQAQEMVGKEYSFYHATTESQDGIINRLRREGTLQVDARGQRFGGGLWFGPPNTVALDFLATHDTYGIIRAIETPLIPIISGNLASQTFHAYPNIRQTPPGAMYFLPDVMRATEKHPVYFQTIIPDKTVVKYLGETTIEPPRNIANLLGSSRGTEIPVVDIGIVKRMEFTQKEQQTIKGIDYLDTTDLFDNKGKFRRDLLKQAETILNIEESKLDIKTPPEEQLDIINRFDRARLTADALDDVRVSAVSGMTFGFAAVKEGRIAGAASFSISNFVTLKWGEYDQLYLQHIGAIEKGVGSELLKQVENYAIERGIKEIELKPLQQAVGFYEKHGYVFDQKREYMHKLFDEDDFKISLTQNKNIKFEFTKKEQLKDINLISIDYTDYKSGKRVDEIDAIIESSFKEIDESPLSNAFTKNIKIKISSPERQSTERYSSYFNPYTGIITISEYDITNRPVEILSHEIWHQQGSENLILKHRVGGIEDVVNTFIDLTPFSHVKDQMLISRTWAEAHQKPLNEIKDIVKYANFNETTAIIAGIRFSNQGELEFNQEIRNIVSMDTGWIDWNTQHIGDEYVKRFENITDIYNKPQFTKKEQLRRVSPQEAIDLNLFKPVWHGTTPESLANILKEGFDVPIGEARTGFVRGGYTNLLKYGGYYNLGVPAPIHHLGFGVYFSTIRNRAREWNVGPRGGIGSLSGLLPFAIKADRLETFNIVTPEKMVKWWQEHGYDTDIAKYDRLEATLDMTNQLSDKFDAVWFKGKSGWRNALDADQIVVFDPDNISLIDNKLAKPWEIGSKVQSIKEFDHTIGEITRFRNDQWGGILPSGDRGYIAVKQRYGVSWYRPEDLVPYETGKKPEFTQKEQFNVNNLRLFKWLRGEETRPVIKPSAFDDFEQFEKITKFEEDALNTYVYNEPNWLERRSEDYIKSEVMKRYEIKNVKITHMSYVEQGRHLLDFVNKPGVFYHATRSSGVIDTLKNTGELSIQIGIRDESALFFGEPNTLYSWFLHNEDVVGGNRDMRKFGYGGGVIRLQTEPVSPSNFINRIEYWDNIVNKKQGKVGDIFTKIRGRDVMQDIMQNVEFAEKNRLYPGPKPLVGFEYGGPEIEFVIPTGSVIYNKPTALELITRGTRWNFVGERHILMQHGDLTPTKIRVADVSFEKPEFTKKEQYVPPRSVIDLSPEEYKEIAIQTFAKEAPAVVEFLNEESTRRLVTQNVQFWDTWLNESERGGLFVGLTERKSGAGASVGYHSGDVGVALHEFGHAYDYAYFGGDAGTYGNASWVERNFRNVFGKEYSGYETYFDAKYAFLEKLLDSGKLPEMPHLDKNVIRPRELQADLFRSFHTPMHTIMLRETIPKEYEILTRMYGKSRFDVPTSQKLSGVFEYFARKGWESPVEQKRGLGLTSENYLKVSDIISGKDHNKDISDTFDVRIRIQDLEDIVQNIDIKKPAFTKKEQYTGEIRKFITVDQLEKHHGWGGEWWYQVKGDASAIRNVIENREYVPDTLYHVTTNLPAVIESGILLHMEKGTGLGKGQGLVHSGVSLTTSIDDAILIQREMGRVVSLSHGEDFVSSMMKWVDEDRSLVAFESEKYKISDSAANALQWFEFSKPMSSNIKNLSLDAIRQYRGERRVIEDPIIYGREEDFSKILPENIGIVTISKADIPSDVVLRAPLGDFMHEILVHSDVPISGVYKRPKFTKKEQFSNLKIKASQLDKILTPTEKLLLVENLPDAFENAAMSIDGRDIDVVGEFIVGNRDKTRVEVDAERLHMLLQHSSELYADVSNAKVGLDFGYTFDDIKSISNYTNKNKVLQSVAFGEIKIRSTHTHPQEQNEPPFTFSTGDIEYLIYDMPGTIISPWDLTTEERVISGRSEIYTLSKITKTRTNVLKWPRELKEVSKIPFSFYDLKELEFQIKSHERTHKVLKELAKRDVIDYTKHTIKWDISPEQLNISKPDFVYLRNFEDIEQIVKPQFTQKEQFKYDFGERIAPPKLQIKQYTPLEHGTLRYEDVDLFGAIEGRQEIPPATPKYIGEMLDSVISGKYTPTPSDYGALYFSERPKFTKKEQNIINWNVKKTGISEFDLAIKGDEDAWYRAELEWMPPAKYIQTQIDIFEVRRQNRLASGGKPIEKPAERMFYDVLHEYNVEKLMESMKKGDTFNTLAIEFNAKGELVDYQEGRHRSVAALRLDEDTIPVWKMFKEEPRWLKERRPQFTEKEQTRIGEYEYYLDTEIKRIPKKWSNDLKKRYYNALRAPDDQPLAEVNKLWITRDAFDRIREIKNTPDLPMPSFSNIQVTDRGVIALNPETKQPVGAASYSHVKFLDDRYTRIDYLGVLERKKGIGTSILSIIEEETLQRKIPYIKLYPLDEAVPFYENRGFGMIKQDKEYMYKYLTEEKPEFTKKKQIKTPFIKIGENKIQIPKHMLDVVDYAHKSESDYSLPEISINSDLITKREIGKEVGTIGGLFRGSVRIPNFERTSGGSIVPRIKEDKYALVKLEELKYDLKTITPKYKSEKYPITIRASEDYLLPKIVQKYEYKYPATSKETYDRIAYGDTKYKQPAYVGPIGYTSEYTYRPTEYKTPVTPRYTQTAYIGAKPGKPYTGAYITPSKTGTYIGSYTGKTTYIGPSSYVGTTYIGSRPSSYIGSYPRPGSTYVGPSTYIGPGRYPGVYPTTTYIGSYPRPGTTYIGSSVGKGSYISGKGSYISGIGPSQTYIGPSTYIGSGIGPSKPGSYIAPGPAKPGSYISTNISTSAAPGVYVGPSQPTTYISTSAPYTVPAKPGSNVVVAYTVPIIAPPTVTTTVARVTRKKPRPGEEQIWLHFKKQAFYLYPEITPTWTPKQMATLFPMRIAARRYRETGEMMVGGKFHKATPPPKLHQKRKPRRSTANLYNLL